MTRRPARIGAFGRMVCAAALVPLFCITASADPRPVLVRFVAATNEAVRERGVYLECALTDILAGNPGLQPLSRLPDERPARTLGDVLERARDRGAAYVLSGSFFEPVAGASWALRWELRAGANPPSSDFELVDGGGLPLAADADNRELEALASRLEALVVPHLELRTGAPARRRVAYTWCFECDKQDSDLAQNGWNLYFTEFLPTKLEALKARFGFDVEDIEGSVRTVCSGSASHERDLALAKMGQAEVVISGLLVPTTRHDTIDILVKIAPRNRTARSLTHEQRREGLSVMDRVQDLATFIVDHWPDP